MILENAVTSFFICSDITEQGDYCRYSLITHQAHPQGLKRGFGNVFDFVDFVLSYVHKTWCLTEHTSYAFN